MAWLRFGKRTTLALAALLPALSAIPATARDSLGLFASWGAYRDPQVPRCYAIAIAAPSTKERDYQPYATVGTWPLRKLRTQVHLRLSRKLSATARVRLQIGADSFALVGGGGDAWPADNRTNAAIVAKLRSAPSMTVFATDNRGRNFSNTWTLAGAASAMDAMTLACARAG